jgi:PAS domain S-box-containing protein
MKIKDKRKEHLLKDLAEKEKAEEAPRASEEQLRLITNQVPAILWTTDTELKFTSSTGAGLDALGLKTDQVVGMSLFEYLQTDDQENLVIKAYCQAIKGNIANYEFEWEGRVFECHVRPLQNKEGSIIGTIGFALDITERKQAEIALRESERKYKDLQDASIDGHAWTDMEGHLIEVNDSYENMMGYSEDELRKLTYKDVTPEKWHASEQIILTEQILARGYSDIYEKELIRKDGTIFPVELRAYLIKDAQGNNKGMRAVVRNITDRKKAEVELRESEDRFRGLIDAEFDGIIIYEADKIRETNPSFDRMFGYNHEEVIDKSASEFVTLESYEKIKKNIQTGHEKLYEVIGVKKDGSTFEIESIAKNCRYHGRKARVVAMRDITVRKQTEKALMESDNKLRMKAKELEESNTALKVLLKQRENDKDESESNILDNVKYLIMPYIEKLKKSRAISEDLVYLNILESNLKEIISPFAQKLSSNHSGLTPKEIQVANLTRDGKQDKEISEILNISLDTVKFHRKNIRKKLGLNGQRTNLRSYLLSEFK